MVQKWPLFNYKAQLSTIQINLSASTSAIYGQHLEPQLSPCLLSGSFKIFYFRNRPWQNMFLGPGGMKVG